MQIIIVKFVDSFFRRVPTGARLKGDTLKLETYNIIIIEEKGMNHGRS